MLSHKDQQRSKSVVKTTHSLASPFAEASWPQIQPDDQQAILDLLCTLLVDLGQYHRSLVVSKGKRRKRAKRKPENGEPGEGTENLPRPEIRSHVLIGFNEVQRHLETMILEKSRVKADRSQSLSNEKSTDNRDDSSKNPDTDNNVVAVFVDRANQPLIMTRHLPNMMAAAASNKSSLWLVTLPSGGGIQLGETVGIPRLGFCGVMAKAPGSIPLLHYVKENIQPVSGTLLSTTFLPLKVDSYEVEVESKLSGTKSRRRQNLTPDDYARPDFPKSKKRRRRKQLISQ